MPRYNDVLYTNLYNKYRQLPWYQKIFFWFSAPRLAWGLFGFRQNPNELRVEKLIAWAKASWFFKTRFEKWIINYKQTSDVVNVVNSQKADESHKESNVSVTPIMNTASNYNKPQGYNDEVGPGQCGDVIGAIYSLLPGASKRAYAAINKFHRNADVVLTDREQTITNNLLKAVAYGMWRRTDYFDKNDKEGNVFVTPEDTCGLFKYDLYAYDLLKKSPEYLFKEGALTDWGGRTFEKISPFKYALWAQDFDMIKGMVDCVLQSKDADNLIKELLKQYNEVTAPTEAGGGVSYWHTYDRPNLDANGIPDGTFSKVKEYHTENYFDFSPLLSAYKNYCDGYYGLRSTQLNALWNNLIGGAQRLLPVHVMQRFCDPNTAFYSLPQFSNRPFNRNFLLCSEDFDGNSIVSFLAGRRLGEAGVVYRGGALPQGTCPAGSRRATYCRLDEPTYDFAALARLNEISKSEIEKCMQPIAASQSASLRP